MLDKNLQKQYRSQLFRHLDGIVTAPTAFCLYEHQVFDFILEKRKVEIGEISSRFQANEGYLNVALRTICSQSWLDMVVDNENDKVYYKINPQTETAISYFGHYEEVVSLLKYTGGFHPRKFEKLPFEKMKSVFKSYQNRMGMASPKTEKDKEIQEQILHHIEGLLIGPTIVRLAMGGMFHKYFMQASFRAEEYHEDAESFATILNFFTHLDWFHKKNDTYTFTDKGLFFAKRATAYGVTVSYLPTFQVLDELIFGNPLVLQSTDGEDEKHVDREMNVWGSGGAHTTYFKIVDEIIIDLFNKPISEQPKGVLDMGCGNGAFLEHIFEVISQRTSRGKVLDEYPLILVGADYNQAALKVTRANLIKADIWAKVVWGDIGRPDLLSKTLSEDYNIQLSELLNVRTFLDHNRIWKAPTTLLERNSMSTGAYASKGQRLSNNEVESSLKEHLESWAPYIKKYGLLLIELHTISPELCAANLGNIAATAYDATHGFSDQYILEKTVFEKVANEAGLETDNRLHASFPSEELATVSVNLLREKGS